MKHTLFAASFSSVLFTSQSFGEDQVATSDEAKAQTLEWVKNLENSKIKYSTLEHDSVFKFRFTEGTPLGDVTAFTLNTGTESTTIAFKGKVTKATTVEELKASFLYVAMDKIATPNLTVKGWSITPITPTSSFKEGVSIISFKEGKLTFNIKSKCFAVSGKKLGVLVPADAPIPKSAYFRITQSIPLEVTLSGKIPE